MTNITIEKLDILNDEFYEYLHSKFICIVVLKICHNFIIILKTKITNSSTS